MRRLTAVMLGIAFLAGLNPPSAAAQKIRTEDGVRVVYNGKKPKPPKGVADKIVLEEEISIGRGEDPESSFVEPTGFVVDDEGNVFALDMKDRKIKVFDREGRFLRSIGKPGQGPGELGMPSGIQLNSRNELVVEDALSRRLTFFTREGEFLRHLSMTGMLGLVNILLDERDGLLGREMGVEGQQIFFKITKFDSDLKPLFTLDKIAFEIPIPGSGAKINIMDMLAIYAQTPDGRIYYCRNQEYAVLRYTADGGHELTIRKESKPVKVTEDDIEEMMARIPNTGGPVNARDLLEFPEEFPPIQNFSLDEEGRLHVRTWEKGEKEREYFTDVFDAEGRYIARYAFRDDMREWRKGWAFAIGEDDEGYKVIRLYRVRWE